jgi:uncharacterized protein (TIGR02246 family)
MSDTTSTEIVADLLAELEAAWNAGDGARFGAAFTEEADFVDVRGVHHHGRAEIADGHQAIFDTVYKDSTVRYQPVSTASVADGCLLGHASATLDVPAGPLQGTHRALLSVVIVDDASTWKVRSFHNTLVTG